MWRPVASPPMVGTVPGVGGGVPASPSGDAPSPVTGGPRPPVVRGPALVVLGIAVLIVVIGLIAAAVSSGSGTPGGTSAPRPSLRPVTLADGTIVPLVAATTDLRALEFQGDPPPDILDYLAVPAGSRITGTVNDDLSAELYDRTASFETDQAGDVIVDAYKAALSRLGWRVIYSGPGTRRGRSGTEVLAKRGSNDGYDWEVGVVVSPANAAGTTPFSVEVFELSGVT